MESTTKIAGFINGKKVSRKYMYVNARDIRRDEVLEEVRQAMWKKASKLYSMGIEDGDIKKEPLKALTLVGNEIDKFIDKLLLKELI